MKQLRRLFIMCALSGCALSTEGLPIVLGDGGGSDVAPDTDVSGLDGGVPPGDATADRDDAHTSLVGCPDVDDIRSGYDLACAPADCPWPAKLCAVEERVDCLSALQTAAGVDDCDAFNEALTSPLCTEACAGALDGGTPHDAGAPDTGLADGGPRALIASGDACNALIALWTDEELTSACFADGPGGATPGRCPGWSPRYCDRDMVYRCLDGIAEAARAPRCDDIFALWLTPTCADACDDDFMP